MRWGRVLPTVLGIVVAVAILWARGVIVGAIGTQPPQSACLRWPWCIPEWEVVVWAAVNAGVTVVLVMPVLVGVLVIWTWVHRRKGVKP